MNRLQLRTATQCDTDVLVSMITQLYAHEDIPCDGFSLRRNLKTLVDDHDLGKVLLIESAGRAIGYAIIIYFFSLEHGGLTALLDELLILEEFRGAGYGGRALDELFAFCEASGLSAVQLEVLNENTQAKNLYIKKGFEVRDRSLMVRPIARRDDIRKAS